MAGAFDDLLPGEKQTGGAFGDLVPARGATGSWTPKEPTRAERIIKGLRDPVDGAAQLLTNALPASLVSAGNNVNNWLADKTGLVGRLPDGGVNQQVKQSEADYQSARGPNAGFDGYRVAGNILSPANLAIAAKAPLAASLAGRLGVGAATGAASGAMNPVTSDDFWTDKAKQVGIGAAFSGALPAVTGAIGRFISPNASTNPNLQLLKNEGIKPTIGQALGGWANKAEEKAMSLPIMGDAIAYARNNSVNDLNRAVYNRSLAPINQTLPKNVALGNEAVDFTKNALGKSYDRLLPKLATQADDGFYGQVQNVRDMVSNSVMDPKYTQQFDKFVQTRVLDKFQGQNSISGQTLKDTQGFIGTEIKRFGASQDPDARLYGDALKEVGSQLNKLTIRSNPDYATELKAIDTGYANFKRAQKAASYLGADEGVFTASQLQGAVRAADRSKDKARFAEGNAYMQDLSGAGKSLLSNKVNDSGTAGRVMLGAGALGSGMLNPAIPLGLLGGAAMYSSPMQGLLSGAVSARPQSAQAISDALLKASPRFLPGAAQMGLSLLD